MGDSQKKKLTADQKARLASDISVAFKQMEEEETKKQNLKLFTEKLVKENHELKTVNNVLLLRLNKLEEEQISTKKELSDTREELISTKKELSDTQEKLANTIKELGDTQEKLANTIKELGDTQEKLVKTDNLLFETIEEQKKQREIIILLSNKFKDLKMEEPPKTK